MINDEQIKLKTQVIRELQHTHHFLTLCGSISLIISKVLPVRHASDIDFVLNEKHFKLLNFDHRLTVYEEDKYTEEINKNDKYKSYHASFDAVNCSSAFLNFLVFSDSVKLPWEIITDGTHQYRSQPVDTILKWKQKYNRKKDIEDLNKIANIEIESILAS